MSASPRTGLKSRRVRALLAGGLVLGVGGTVVLAAWTDSEFAEATFTAGSFNLEGSDDGTTYADQDTVDNALGLTFTDDLGGADLVGNMAPDDVVYASYFLRLAAYFLRLAAGTTVDAEVTPVGITGTDPLTTNSDAISWSLIEVTAGSCEAGTATGNPVASGTDLTAATFTAEGVLSLTAGADGAAGAPVELCFTATAGPEGTFEQGLATDATWQFDAVSL
ncbi:SipW-dependent-type signal peptide-containing protein [Brevibacterium litoralis]|uniref:SipW-dependent-type signal peptide-containing protein n=1 Tax=Brevibacterium litoralis TaxID=3138935 RepID=UPI0032ECBF4E